jgi:hypothetical protein
MAANNCASASFFCITSCRKAHCIGGCWKRHRRLEHLEWLAFIPSLRVRMLHARGRALQRPYPVGN